MAKTKKLDTIVRSKKYINIKSHKNKYLKAQEVLIYLIATDLQLRQILFNALNIDDFIDDIAKNIYTHIKNTNLSSQELVENITQAEEKNYLTKIIIKGEDQHYAISDKTIYKEYIDVLKLYRKNQKIEQIQQQIKQLSNNKENDDKLNKLLNELLDLKKQGGKDVILNQ